MSEKHTMALFIGGPSDGRAMYVAEPAPLMLFHATLRQLPAVSFDPTEIITGSVVHEYMRADVHFPVETRVRLYTYHATR